MDTSAVIFPGQGSQVVGMGRDVVAVHSRARQVFEQANAILGFDLSALCFDGPAERLEQTDIQQPAIFVASIALWEVFREGQSDRFRPRAMGGLSLGEYTALHAAGAVSFEDALRLVQLRGRLMQAAAEATPSGMVSLVGADENTAQRLCTKAREADVLVCANFNCPGQVVLSGSRAACRRAVALAEEFQCRALPLPVAGAFHSPLMASAADGLWPALQATAFHTPAVPVIANVDAAYHGNADSIRDSLRRQLTQPVQWQRCVERLVTDGCDCFMEVGPGRVLTGLMRKINRSMRTVNISTAETLAAACSQPV